MLAPTIRTAGDVGPYTAFPSIHTPQSKLCGDPVWKVSATLTDEV